MSKLPFISKLVDKIVAGCIEKYMHNNDVHNLYESAYGTDYSTKTALLKVHSDTAETLDNGSIVALMPLIGSI